MIQRYILFLSDPSYDTTDDVAKWLDWYRAHTPFEPVVTYQAVNVPLAFKDFNVSVMYQGVLRKLWGLDGIKELLRPFVPVGQYHEVVFFYPKPATAPDVANWTYPNDLNGASFSEMVSTQAWDVDDNLAHTLQHENIHRFIRELGWKGAGVIDDLDLYDVPQNEIRNLARVANHWDVLGQLPPARKVTLQKSLIAALQQLVLLYQKLLPPKALPLVEALIQVESEGNDNAEGDLNLTYHAYGPLQIRQPYMDDALPGHAAQECKGNRPLSIQVFQAYMARYATPERIGRPVTDQDRARIHNGGPGGWKSPFTLTYWAKVSKLLS